MCPAGSLPNLSADLYTIINYQLHLKSPLYLYNCKMTCYRFAGTEIPMLSARSTTPFKFHY